MNSWNFTGNLGQDCRVGNVGGTPVVNFSVASTSGFGDKKVTTWVDCALWGNRGTALQSYLTKGQKVAITGEHSTREHDGKTYTTCRVDNVTLIGDKQDNQQNNQSYQQPSNNQQTPNPYAQQVAQNAQGMKGQVNNQFAQQNQAPQQFNNQMSNQAPKGYNQPPVDDGSDIPF